jgi:hypothetical protein
MRRGDIGPSGIGFYERGQESFKEGYARRRKGLDEAIISLYPEDKKSLHPFWLGLG